MLAAARPAPAQEIPLIDAHSQLHRDADAGRLISRLDRAGVARVILSPLARDPEDVMALARAFPKRVVPALTTKSGPGDRDFQGTFDGQLKRFAWVAMAETLLWHAAKGKRAPEIVQWPDDEKIQFLLNHAKARGWPFTAHIEFGAIGAERARFLAAFEAMLAANPDHPFVVPHMGQLEADEMAALIARHANLHFTTSHANPLTARKYPDYPWVNMFADEDLAPRWKALIVAHPDRFVLAFDNVWPKHWGRFFVKQVKLWKRALAGLPEEVAHAVAHRNAERLWKLAPLE